MRLAQRLIGASILIALAGPLTGCGGGGLTGFDPSDLLDFLDTKKKLPGERKPVFPEGVPGMQQGVPKELYKGGVAEPAPELEPPPPAEPKAKRVSKARSKAASRAPKAAPAEPDAAPVEDSAAPAAPPAPKGRTITSRRTTAPPPDSAAPAPAAATPAAAQPAPSAFPAPLPSGGFSR